MGINELAELMDVSPRDAADFVAGVKLQMGRGLDLHSAIVANREAWGCAYEHMAARSDNSAYGERMRAYVVDTFYPGVA